MAKTKPVPQEALDRAAYYRASFPDISQTEVRQAIQQEFGVLLPWERHPIPLKQAWREAKAETPKASLPRRIWLAWLLATCLTFVVLGLGVISPVLGAVAIFPAIALVLYMLFNGSN